MYVNSFFDEVANTIRARFNPNWPLEILNIWTLTEHDGKTTLTMRGEPINATVNELKTYESIRHMVQQGFAGNRSRRIS